MKDIVDFKELEELYNSCQILDDRSKGNKVILGLLIYQGLTTGELHQLEPPQIKLDEGKIYISSKGKTNSRTLALDSSQLLDLLAYLEQISPRMLTNN